MDLIKYIILCIFRDSDLKNNKVTIGKFDKQNVKGGDTATIQIKGENLKKQNIEVYCLGSKGLVDSKEISYSITGNDTLKTIKFLFNNKSNTSKEKYRINVKYNSDKDTISSMNLITLEPSNLKETSMKVADISSKMHKLKAEAGYSPIIIKGEYLDKNNIKINLLDEATDTNLDITPKEFRGDTNKLETVVEIPKNTTSKEKNLVIQILNKTTNEVLGKTRILISKNVENKTINNNLQCTKVYKNDANNIITLEFNESIANNDVAILKHNIKLARNYKSSIGLNSNLEELSPEDKVEIKDNKVILTLNRPFDETEILNLIRLEVGALKNSKGHLSPEFTEAIKRKSEFKKPEYLGIEKGRNTILDSKGGNVEIQISGKNLKVFKQENHSTEGTTAKILDVTSTTPTNIPVKIEGEGTKQTLRFTLPENKSDKTKTYLLSISIDGGVTNVPEDRKSDSKLNRIVVSVLPKNKSNTDITLSHMTIACYGAKTENVEDNTSAETPLNQESKKTLIEVYGTNLKKEKTKVRAIDENGVVWPVINDPAHDSHDVFIMVAFHDKSGILLNGNHQMLEVICPNNIKGNPQYKIQVAPDGEHFDENTFVNVTVPSYNVSDKEKKVQTVEINYVDESGNQIAEPLKNVKAYSWFFNPVYKFNIKDIDNYKFKEIKSDSTNLNKKIYVYSKK